MRIVHHNPTSGALRDFQSLSKSHLCKWSKFPGVPEKIWESKTERECHVHSCSKVLPPLGGGGIPSGEWGVETHWSPHQHPCATHGASSWGEVEPQDSRWDWSRVVKTRGHFFLYKIPRRRPPVPNCRTRHIRAGILRGILYFKAAS